MAMYWVKYLLLFIGGWAFFVLVLDAGYPGFRRPAPGPFTAGRVPEGDRLVDLLRARRASAARSGPMNARFKPPIGGFLHFLRPGTTKLPLLPGPPGARRHPAHAGSTSRSTPRTSCFLLRALVAPEITPALLLPSCRADPAARRHGQDALPRRARASTTGWRCVCLTVAERRRALDLRLQGDLVLRSGSGRRPRSSTITSRRVIMVMMNNGPFFPEWLKKRLFVSLSRTTCVPRAWRRRWRTSAPSPST